MVPALVWGSTGLPGDAAGGQAAGLQDPFDKAVCKAGCHGTGVLWAFRAGVSALFRRSEAEGGVTGIYPLCELEPGSLM